MSDFRKEKDGAVKRMCACVRDFASEVSRQFCKIRESEELR